MFRFQYHYFILAVLLFLIELYIALFVHDQVIRPHVGDVLVVILMYCILKSFLNVPFIIIAVSVLIFSYVVETLQYFKITEVLHLQHSKLARTVIGTTFSWLDILAYTIGIGFVLLVEKICRHY